MEPQNESDLFEILRREQSRLKTFTNWPVTNISPEDLAADGLYYIGGGGCQCVFCGGSLRDWDTNDTVRGTHKRLYPMCPFINGQYVGNIPRSAQSNPTPKRDNKAHTGSTYDPNVSSRNNDYSKLENRLETFSNWPEDNAQTPKELAEAGFIYCGTDDRVKCFQCEGELDNFEPSNDPWKLHASRFPYCNHVYLAKGQAFINKVKRLSFHNNVQNESPPRKTEKQPSNLALDKQWDGHFISKTRCQGNRDSGTKGQEGNQKHGERNQKHGLAASSKEQCSNFSSNQQERQGFIPQMKMPCDFDPKKSAFNDIASSNDQIYSGLALEKQQHGKATSNIETFNKLVSIKGACADSVLSSQPKFGAGKDEANTISQGGRDFRSEIIQKAGFHISKDNPLTKDDVCTGTVDHDEKKPIKATDFNPSQQACAVPSPATSALPKTSAKLNQNSDLRNKEIERELREALELVSGSVIGAKPKIQKGSHDPSTPTPQENVACSSSMPLHSIPSAGAFGASKSFEKAYLGNDKMKIAPHWKPDHTKPELSASGGLHKQTKVLAEPTLGKSNIPSTSESNTRRTTVGPRPVSDSRMCKICTAEEMDAVFLPCKHMAVCTKCSKRVDLCPICRAPIVSVFQPILS